MYDHIRLIEIPEHNGHHNDARYALFTHNSKRTNVFAQSLYNRFTQSLYNHFAQEILLEREDFVMIALATLWIYTEKYDPSRGRDFWGYVRKRVSGAIIDELRRLHLLPRATRNILKKIVYQQQEIEGRLQRKASFEEACMALGISDTDKVEELRRASSIHFVGLDSLHEISNGDEQLPGSDEHDTLPKLQGFIQQLETSEQKVITLYFFDGLYLRQIGSIMGLTESRISQIRKQALKKLKCMMEDKTRSPTDTPNKHGRSQVLTKIRHMLQ